MKFTETVPKIYYMNSNKALSITIHTQGSYSIVLHFI